MLLGRRHHPKVRVLPPLLLGSGSGSGWSPAPLGSCGSPPLPHFLKHLLGSPASVSGVPRGEAAEPCSLTLHFLRKSCGLTEHTAAAAAARVRLRSTRNAHGVLAVFRGLGLAGADLARVVANAPFVLSYSFDRTLQPKIDFYRRDIGLTDAEIRRILLVNPSRVLCYSLANHLRPNHALLKGLLGSDKNVREAVKQHAALIHVDPRDVLLPKVKILLGHGVPEAAIVNLVVRHPGLLMRGGSGSHFDESLAAIKELGVSTSSGMFPYTLGLFVRLHPQGWKQRMENYLSLGWTEQQVKQAFVRRPHCMSVSAAKVRRIWLLLAGRLGWSPEYVAGTPGVLSLSYEKRLLPRCAVLDVLASRGVVKRGILVSHLMLGEKRFVERYITRYQEAIPEVLEAYSAGLVT